MVNISGDEGIPRIHEDLIQMFNRVRGRALVAAMDKHMRADLGELLQARREEGPPRGSMTVRERAWHNGTTEALDALIDATRTASPQEGDAHHGL